MSQREDNSTTRATCNELDSDVNSQLLAPYINQARWISQSIHPYISIPRVFYAGLPEARDEGVNSGDTYSREEIHAFNAIMKLQGGFRAVVNATANKTGRLPILTKKLSEASCASRADDTSKLKNAILDYIHEDPKKGSTFPLELQEKLVATDLKSLRGFRNIETARHLCPLKFKASFEEDPRAFLDRIQKGSIIVTAHDLPSFLYDHTVQYCEHDEATGLFRGFLLVRVYRHIFTGPSTALNPTQNAPKSKAKLFNLKVVTGRTIAYACVQTYIALSTMPKWGYSHKQFRLDVFYDNIVSMFEENADNPWVIETLSWWNDQVPALQKGKQIPESDIGPRSADRIAAQLRARTRNANQQAVPHHQTSMSASYSLQHKSPPAYAHTWTPPSQSSYSHHDDPRHSPWNQECSRPLGRLTSTVKWWNPGCTDHDNTEWYGGGVQVPIEKKRKLAVAGGGEESGAELDSQDEHEHRHDGKGRKRRKEGPNEAWQRKDVDRPHMVIVQLPESPFQTT